MDRKWKLQDIAKALRNSLMAIMRGEFLLRLDIGRYFVHIVYTFFLIAMVIWISLMIEGTMTKVERSKSELRELEIVHTQKVFDLESLSKRSSVRDLLEKKGSKVTEPTRPATMIK